MKLIILLLLIFYINLYNAFNAFDIFDAFDIYDHDHFNNDFPFSLEEDILQPFKDAKNAKNFTGKVVLVTGSNSGIGEGIAKLFSFYGANIVITGRNVTRIKSVANEARALSPYKLKPLEIAADLTIADDVKRLISATYEKYKRIDVLVNDAGQYIEASIVNDTFLDTFDKLFAINTRAYLAVAQEALPYLEKTNGTITNIVSIQGYRPLRVGAHIYSITKAALVMATQILALELAPNIRVNAISPGLVPNTRLWRPGSIAPDYLELYRNHTQLDRLGRPMDVAKVAVFLASSDAEWITGANYFVDGGWMLS